MNADLCDRVRASSTSESFRAEVVARCRHFGVVRGFVSWVLGMVARLDVDTDLVDQTSRCR